MYIKNKNSNSLKSIQLFYKPGKLTEYQMFAAIMKDQIMGFIHFCWGKPHAHLSKISS
jgi:hypothetical protein